MHKQFILKYMSLLYPYKSIMKNFYHKDNKLIVEYIGVFENLKQDLSSILENLNVNSDTSFALQ